MCDLKCRYCIFTLWGRAEWKDTDMEKTLLSCGVTTKVLVIWDLGITAWAAYWDHPRYPYKYAQGNCCQGDRLISIHMWLNILKGTSCPKTRFWVMGMQSQNISKYSTIIIFEIPHTLESSILNLKVAWRIWCKNSVFM